VSRLAIVVPLRPGSRDAAARLVDQGPPFALEETRFDRHSVYLTDAEAVFVFEASGESRALDLAGEDPALWEAATAWREIMAGRPRLAQTVFTWDRADGESVGS